jgi:uncharacterized membrane protein
MTVLVLGLVLFLGVHSTRLVADEWRSRTIARLGAGPWKGLYTLASLLGFALIVWGYALARQTPVVLWTPPTAMRHVAALLTLLSFWLVAAAYVPRNHLKAAVGHPMVAGVKVWAFAHLLANGTLADLLLFGSFVVWAVLLFRASRRRDRAAGTVHPAGTPAGSALTLVAGTAAWAAFAFWLHGAWIGVRPFG